MASPDWKNNEPAGEPPAVPEEQNGVMERERWSTLAAFGLLALFSLLAFANSLANGFAFDDESIVVQNRLIKSLSYLPELFTSDYWASILGPGYGGNIYRPLVLLSLALNYAVGGLNPFGYHLVNLLLHLAVCSTLYALARQLGLSWVAALATSTLFAVHPLHTEAVTGIVGRAELLMALGVLLAVLWYLREGAPARLGIRCALASWVAFAAALLSKEQAMVLPALLVLADLCLVRAVNGGRDWRQAARTASGRYLGYFLILGAYLALRIAVLADPFAQASQEIQFLDNPLAHVAWDVRVLTALRVAGKYLWLLAWPMKLSADYSYNAIPVVTAPWEPTVLLAGLALAGLLGLGVYAWRRGIRPVVFGVGFTVLTFLPASNFLRPIGTIMGERLFYLPSAGLCLLVGAGWDWLGTRSRQSGLRRRVAMASLGIFALVIFLLTVRTIQRNRDWRNTETLMQSAVQVVPGSAKVQTILSTFLIQEGRIDEAIGGLTEAVRLDPSYVAAYYNLSRAYAAKGNWREAEAVLQRALATSERLGGPAHPAVAESLNRLGALYASPVGRVVLPGRLEQAEPLFQRALAIREKALGPAHPAVAEALSNLTALYVTQRRYAQAEPLIQRALAIREKALGPAHPAVAQSLEEYAGLLRETNRTTEATRMEARAWAIRARYARKDLVK